MARREPILSAGEVRALVQSAERRGPAGLALQAEPVDLLADDRHLRALVPTLRVGYARVAESLRRVLTSVLRAKVEVRDEEPEILTGRGLLSVAEHAACLVVLRIHMEGHEPGFGVLALDPVFTFSVIERLFGGGGGMPQTPSGRSPTALERRMLVRALGPLIDALNEGGEPPGLLRFETRGVESRLDLVPGFSPDGTALHVPFTMTIGADRLASLSLTTPAEVLEPLRGRLGLPRPDAHSAMAGAVRQVGIAVSVELGQVALTLRQLLDLRPGAVLTLDRNRNQELPVMVEGVTKFHGIPVHDEGALAIEITGRQ